MASSSCAKHRKTGINPKWMEEFPWLLSVDDESGMKCSLCRKHSRRPKNAGVGKAPWVDVACKSLTRQSVVKHSKSEVHLSAVRMEADLNSSRKDGGIAMAMQQVVSAQRKAFIGALKCLYFLNKREIAHTTNFVPLLELAKSLGVSYLADIDCGGNAHYTSERFLQEAVQCLGEAVSTPIITHLQESPFFALCIDETTDVTTTKELIEYGKYIFNGEVNTSFLSILALKDGCAVTIADTVRKLCSDLNLDMLHRFCGLGSDGASVMLGARGGVSKLLRDHVPFLVANHCIAHRLALACGQAANEIRYLKEFKDILDQLYRFYSNSSVRLAGLKEIQEVLEDPRLNLTQAKDVRWLSNDKAVSNLRKCFRSVIISLEREASERNNAEAAGLATFVKKYKFVAALYMFSDVLPPLAALSRAFQRQDIDFTVVKPLVLGTKATVDALNLTPGEFFENLLVVVSELEEYGVQQPTGSMVERFKEDIYQKYIATLSAHITARFPDLHLIEGFDIFTPSNIPQDLTLQARHGADKLSILTNHYGSHGVVDAERSKSELKIFNSVVAANSRLKQLTTQEMMKHLLKTAEMKSMFPNLTSLASIGLLLPMSTVDCERGFSTLSRVKTDLRNRLSNIMLNHLLMISIEGPAPSEFPYDKACDLWAGMTNRRISVTQ